MNTAGFSRAVRRQFAFEFFPHTGKENWLLRDIVDDVGSSNLFLAMVHGFNYAFLLVCLMKAYPNALFFFLFLEMPP